jgi:molecular chaperone GrpE
MRAKVPRDVAARRPSEAERGDTPDATADGAGSPDRSAGRGGDAADNPGQGADDPHAADDDTDEERFALLAAETADLRDRLARARADYDNLTKRVARDAAVERDKVRGRVLEEFLQVYELAKLAEQEAARSDGPLAEGIRLVVREFDRLLEAQGAVAIGVVGEPFDARFHEAVVTEAAGGVAAGHVSRVIRSGYRLGDKVLRYAMVAVAPAVP